MKRLVLLVAALCAATLSPAPALAGSGGSYAPVNRPGPRLSVPAADLRAAVDCTPSAYGSRREVALFVPPTGIGPEAYSWSWFAALDKADYPYCTVTLPDNSVGDIQTSAEYVVHAIRHTRSISRHKIALIGHSQGGVSARFALRFWPDTRAMVADYIGLAAVNHGSSQNDILYPDGNGPAFNLQLKTTAAFIKATNSRQETFLGISYTSLSTTHDQFVTPTGTTDLRGPAKRVANISLQDVCPTNQSDHITIGTSDPLAYALTMHAITNSGPSNPRSIDPSVCDQKLMPGVNPATYEADLAAFLETATRNITNAAVFTTEPPLKPYVYAHH
ncbi:esterase/lipase family protein [Micromonospora chokoriensis]